MADIEIINGKKYNLTVVPFREQYLKHVSFTQLSIASCLYCRFDSTDECKKLDSKYNCQIKPKAWMTAKHTDILSGL